MWAIARFDFGLSSDEFLSMTPAMFDHIAQRKLYQQSREELLIGIVSATVANYSFCVPDPPRRPADFMIHPPKLVKLERTPQEQAEYVRGKLMRMFGVPTEGPIVIGMN